jgi:hypothetical protein
LNAGEALHYSEDQLKTSPAQTLQLGEIWVCDGKDMERLDSTENIRIVQNHQAANLHYKSIKMHQAICQGIGPGFWH